MITKELRQELLTLSPEEKAEIIQLLDGINKTPKVVGGAARIRNTRIPVWSLFQSHQMGASDLKILEDVWKYGEYRIVKQVSVA
jgi:hypothetical protein